MRRRVCLMLAILFVVPATGCAQSVADAYSDFLANADVLQRFEVCFDDVESGRHSWYTQGELRALTVDLEEGYLEDEQAREATWLFQEAAETLLRVLKTAPDPAESTEYAQARALFEDAWRLSLLVRAGVSAE